MEVFYCIKPFDKKSSEEKVYFQFRATNGSSGAFFKKIVFILIFTQYKHFQKKRSLCSKQEHDAYELSGLVYFVKE